MSNIITSTTPAQDVVTVLSAAGHGGLGVDLWVGSEPDGTGVLDNVITVYDTTPHRPPEINYSFEYPSIQVRVRRKPGLGQVCREKALSLMNSLHGYVGEVGAIKYHAIRVISGPISLGEDERGRPRYVFNCSLERST